MSDLNKFDPKSLKTEAAILSAAGDLGKNTPTEASVFERFASFMYDVGAAYKANKSNFPLDTAKVFGAFNANYRDASNGFRKELSDSSMVTWASAFGAFAEAGKFTAYETAEIVEKALKLTGSFTTRGARLRKLLAAHPTTLPIEAEIDKVFNPEAKADENPLLTLAKRWQSTVTDKRVAKNDEAAMAQAKANPRQRLAMIAAQEAIAAFVKACEAADGGGMSAADEIAQLKAQLAAQSAPTSSVN